MSTFYSYEGTRATLLIKALAHYQDRLKQGTLTPRDPQYSIAVAHGVYLEPASTTVVSRFLNEAKGQLSDFQAINLYMVEGTDELSTKDIGKLATYAAAAHTYLADLCFRPNHGSISLDEVKHLNDALMRDFKQQFELCKGDVIDSFVSFEDFKIDPEESTTYPYRFQMALALLCGNHLPNIRLCERWLDESNEDAHRALQEWALDHSVMPWATGIGVIESALALADTPDEGRTHEDREDATKRLFPKAED